jgi:hypothetical protein
MNNSLTVTENNWKPEVNSLLRALEAAGCTLLTANNGEDRINLEDTSRENFVSELIACDESQLTVHCPDGKARTLYLVLGNSPGELVADYVCSDVLDAVTTAHYDKWESRKQPTTERVIAKMFRVAAISRNANSFGLSGHVLIAKDGEAWEVARSTGSHLPQWNVGDDIRLTVDGKGNPYFPACEIPRQLPTCPANVLKEVYP